MKLFTNFIQRYLPASRFSWVRAIFICENLNYQVFFKIIFHALGRDFSYQLKKNLFNSFTFNKQKAIIQLEPCNYMYWNRLGLLPICQGYFVVYKSSRLHWFQPCLRTTFAILSTSLLVTLTFALILISRLISLLYKSRTQISYTSRTLGIFLIISNFIVL